MPGEELPGTTPGDVVTWINLIVAAVLSALFGRNALAKHKAKTNMEDATENGGSMDNEHIRGQVYKVLRTEKVLDRQAHDDLCDGRIKLVLEKIETQGKAVAEMKIGLEKVLERLPPKP